MYHLSEGRVLLDISANVGLEYMMYATCIGKVSGSALCSMSLKVCRVDGSRSLNIEYKLRPYGYNDSSDA